MKLSLVPGSTHEQVQDPDMWRYEVTELEMVAVLAYFQLTEIPNPGFVPRNRIGMFYPTIEFNEDVAQDLIDTVTAVVSQMP